MEQEPVERALGAAVWGRKVARLPDEGVLIYSTDLHGNLGDYERLKAIYYAEQLAGNQPILAFCGDLVHGPDNDRYGVDRWPAHLGTRYIDRSVELILDFERFTRRERAFSLIGNHEHAHVGGPVVPKFYPDEARVLDLALGEDAPRIHEFFRIFPLIAFSAGGVVLTHAAPAATEVDIPAFEALSYEGYERTPLMRMADRDTVGALLWSRYAEDSAALALLSALGLGAEGFIAYGHDIVREGYAREGQHMLNVSTSFALFDPRKVYLRLDLARRYSSAADLADDVEILKLYP